ncbi:hypothetical protein EDD76_11772 [Kineothrix alysoides]|uniref:Uncharacterized protein n=1 Tax=Kineothrix alysoides TaxID=1469948 RepID=A0A4R1QNY6_9FIRM|nr:NusG domain II-containing protein [Kineothrix alysoides]TCL55037.1 hypothetical protein EDD76_11772 [Kineothrix alysoides]
MIKKSDLILAGVILIIALAAIVFINVTKKEGAVVVVTIGGDVYKTLPLDEDTTLTIGDKQGDYNVLEIRGGEAKMTEANCPDKICVAHRSIHYDHESIICLPHGVSVEIRDGEKSDVDMIAN